LTEATGYPAWAANDASLGALAERTFGAGRGIDNMLYLNGGASGIGGGIISGGVALAGASGTRANWATCGCAVAAARIPPMHAERSSPK
jgi:predicted NBD/HSP70 family sugar kinase